MEGISYMPMKPSRVVWSDNETHPQTQVVSLQGLVAHPTDNLETRGGIEMKLYEALIDHGYRVGSYARQFSLYVGANSVGAAERLALRHATKVLQARWSSPRRARVAALKLLSDQLCLPR